MAARIYFETSAWNSLNRHPQRRGLIQALKNSGDEIFASVITAGEILRTGNAEKRKELCDAMIGIHGEVRPLLDHPEHLARYVAEDFLQGERTYQIRESRGAARIRSYLEDPASVSEDDRQEVDAWVLAMDEDHLAVFTDLEAVGPRLGPKFHSPQTLERDDFNQLFIDKLPQVAELGLSVERLKQLVAASDVWKAYRASVAFTMNAAIDRMPTTRPGPRGREQKRPGGPDVRQAIYLGVCDTFVVDDAWLRESLTEIAAACGLERRILPSKRFFDEVLEAQLLANLRSLGIAEPGQLLPLPIELADYIAELTPEDIERIRGDAGEMERLGLPKREATP